MKILVVASGNRGKSSFVIQQVSALKDKGIKFDFFWIKGKGILGYLKNLKSLKYKIKKSKCDFVHAHYGLSGLLACLQKIRPVVVTYHGCDINIKKNLILSFFSIFLSKKNIFVHKDLTKKVPFLRSNHSIIPCGVDLQTFYYIDKIDARKQINFEENKKYVLFSSNFDNEVKNYPLARKSIDLINQEVELIELKGYSAEEVNLLLNSVDLLLVTSKRETGPMVIKEAMLTGCPVVSSDVGDAKKLLKGITDSYVITSNCANDFCNAIKKCFNQNLRKSNKKRIIDLELTSNQVADKILSIYNDML